MQKLNLVTVVGHNTTLFPHMLKHYESMVDEIFVVVYRQSEDDGILEEVEKCGITPYMVVTEAKFNWQKVTELYNKVKQTKPNEWWVVADDDEFHLYPKNIRKMIKECEENGGTFDISNKYDNYKYDNPPSIFQFILDIFKPTNA